MQSPSLNAGVVSEARDPLSPRQSETYWVEKGQKCNRIVASSSETIDDEEISWTQARVTEFVRIQRTWMQSLMKKQIEGTILHPSGNEMKKNGAPRTGFLITAALGANLIEETSRRVPLDKACVTQISAEKLFLEGTVPVRIHAIDDSALLDSLHNVELPVEKIEQIYRHAFEVLPTVLNKRLDQFSDEDANLIYGLDEFRKKRVRWASLTPSGGMVAQESGRIGDAWIFVVPPSHSMMKTQPTVHAMNIDATGLNPYLSILPYDMTEKWACLGALHELSHLRDSVLGIEPKENRTRDQYLEGEHRAYSIERSLAFAYSNGRLQQTLQSIVATALARQNPVEALNALVNQQLSSIAQSLDQCIEPNHPRCLSELGVRQGLYKMLLGFEIAQQMAKGDPARQKALEKGFIELVYEPTGYLPKK